MKVRFGLIGFGAWGQHHARAIHEVSGAELVSIAAHSDESVVRAREQYPQVQVYSDYRAMLEKEDLDAVDIVLPSDLHYRVACEVLESGRHLLLEKPMTLDLSEASALVRLARERGKLLAVGHELRLSSLWGRVKDLIDEGAIGQPIYCLIELWRRPYRLGSGGWRYDINRVGSWILEEPIHFFDLARWYMASAGEPTSIYAQASHRRLDHPELLDNLSAMVTFEKGGYAVISQSLAGWEHHQTVKVTGQHGAIWAKWSGAMDRTFAPTFDLHLQRGESLEQISIDKPSGEVYELVDEVGRFVEAIQGNGVVGCTGEEGRWSMAMCLKAEESLRTYMPISLTGLFA
ncbi:Gfo/Idh/MocA family oxidoreductase [bacterium]|nr:Gfo/Idh/MocA family oxidoreductase [bacterium]